MDKEEKETKDILVKPTNVKEFKLFCKYRKSCYFNQSSGNLKRNVEEIPNKKVVMEESNEMYKYQKTQRISEDAKKVKKPCNLLKSKIKMPAVSLCENIEKDATKLKQLDVESKSKQQRGKPNEMLDANIKSKGRKSKKYQTEHINHEILEVEPKLKDPKDVIKESNPANFEKMDLVPESKNVKLESVKAENWNKLSKLERMSICKYRKSCYEAHRNWNDQKIDIKKIKRDHLNTKLNLKDQRSFEVVENKTIDTRDVIKCNEYRLSCREKLGLSNFERAPIGPNGKKLCKRRTKE